MNIRQYSFGELLSHCLYFAYTKIRFPYARLIRLPFYLRGRNGLSGGSGLTLGYGCRFDINGPKGTLTIGDNCNFNDRVHIVAHESVVIGDCVLMASNIFITDTSHGAYAEDSDYFTGAPAERILVTRPTVIGRNAWIGEGACILPGVTLGEGCIVGANAVVTRSFPDHTIVGGVPARALKRLKDGAWVSCGREGADQANLAVRHDGCDADED